jgi:hypothetical protein
MNWQGGELRWIQNNNEQQCSDDDYLLHENELNQEVKQNG